jgi:hypothetical protein
MADKIAGKDVHKNVLMVVVLDARTRKDRSQILPRDRHSGSAAS